MLINQYRESHDILNSRTEFNRCALPRLATRLGEMEMEKWGEELKEEKRREDHIEEKIRQVRKERNRARLLPIRGEPARKRQKMSEGISIRSIWKTTSVRRKSREGSDEDDKEPLRKRIRECERGGGEDGDDREDREEEEIVSSQGREDRQTEARLSLIHI